MGFRPFNPEKDRTAFAENRLYEFVGGDQFDLVTDFTRFLEAYQNPGLFFVLGGPGSGNWGHKGTPGKRGGSMKTGRGGIPSTVFTKSGKQPEVVAAKDTVNVLRTSKILPDGPWFTPMSKGFIPPRKPEPITRPVLPGRTIAPVDCRILVPPPAPTGRQIAEVKRPKFGYIIGEGETAQKVITSDEKPTFSGRTQVAHAEGNTLNAKTSLESLLTNEVKAKLNEEYETLDWDDLFEELKDRPDDVLGMVIGAALQVREE